METIYLILNNIIKIPYNFNLCLGYFDGIHLGHKRLINEAKKDNTKVALLTFDHSPNFVLGKIKTNDMLTSIKDKERLLQELEVDYLLVLPFNNEVKNLSKDDFVNLVLKKLNPSKLFCGKDYHFGKNADGDAVYLKKFFNTQILDFLNDEDNKISSKDIRQFIKDGNINKANYLLGRYYSISGTVIKGKQNGKKIGFPTLNIALDFPYVIPKDGVYIGYIYFNNLKYRSLICIGKHPSIDELNDSIIEVHILDFNKEIYGENLHVYFLTKIRDIIKFNNAEDLKRQIEKDKEIAIKYLQ